MHAFAAAHDAVVASAVNKGPSVSSMQQVPYVGADEGSRESVDAKCRRLTATWVREKATSDPSVETCSFNEGLDAAGQPLACLTGHL